MKIFTNVVIFIILVLGGFWIGMQWANASKKQDITVPPVVTVVQQPTPPPELSEPPVTPIVVAPTEVVTVEPPVVPTENSILTQLLPNEEVIRYENARFKYGFDVSKKVYYSAFGAQ